MKLNVEKTKTQNHDTLNQKNDYQHINMTIDISGILPDSRRIDILCRWVEAILRCTGAISIPRHHNTQCWSNDSPERRAF